MTAAKLPISASKASSRAVSILLEYKSEAMVNPLSIGFGQAAVGRWRARRSRHDAISRPTYQKIYEL
jgi:hypothetical protein